MFPVEDKFWCETADFVLSHIVGQERIFAPAEFEEKFPGRLVPYRANLAEQFDCQWAIIHKGLVNEIESIMLKRVKKRPAVFANEVFIVFSGRNELPRVESTSPHVKSFVDKSESHESIPGRIKGTMMDIALRNRRTIRKIPLLGSAAKLVYYRMQPSESVLESGNSPRVIPSQSSSGRDSGRDMIYLGDNRALTRTVFGQKMFVDTRDYSLAPHILLDGYWEMWITKFYEKILNEGMTVVEVGCNIGYYTLLEAAKIGASGKLYAFEANPDVFNTLFRNIEINGFLDRVTPVNKAVIDKSRKLKFHKLKHHHGSSSIMEDKAYLELYVDEVDRIEVDAISLDEYFADKDTKIDIIKMDAEGSEGLIFKGMRKLLQKSPDIKIICEFVPGVISTTGIDPRQFLEELKGYGFRLRIINTDSKLEDISVDQLLKASYCELFLSKEANSKKDYSSLPVSGIKTLMDERYSKNDAYNITCLWDGVRAEEVNKQVIDAISSTRGKKILDVGAGIGGSVPLIAECKEFVGTDISEVAMSQARQTYGHKPNFRFVAMDAMDLKFEDNYFDIVIAREIIEHLPEPQKALKEAFRVLCPGGLLVVTSPNRDSLHLRVNRMLGHRDFMCSSDHVRELTYREATDILTAEGFLIKKTGGVFLQPYWGIPGIDEHVRRFTDNDPEMVENLRCMGERIGAEYAFCFVISAIKPE